MQTILSHLERQKRILDFWFSPLWDRNSEPPSSLFSLWFGSSEEQKKIDNQIKDLFEEDINNVDIHYYLFLSSFLGCKRNL